MYRHINTRYIHQININIEISRANNYIKRRVFVLTCSTTIPSIFNSFIIYSELASYLNKLLLGKTSCSQEEVIMSKRGINGIPFKASMKIFIPQIFKNISLLF